MSRTQSRSHEKKPSVDVSKMPASHGDASVVETPKDVAPHDAAARDLTERNVTSDNPAEREEALLDDAIDLSFPASDPIAVPSITRVEPHKKAEEAEDAGTSEKEPPESPIPDRKH